MGLFNKKEQNKPNCCGDNCGCNNNQPLPQSRFIVLGACCKKSLETFHNAEQAVRELGFTDQVVNIGDAMEIAKFGVMQLPALIIDNKVVAFGRLLKVEEIKDIITKLEVK